MRIWASTYGRKFSGNWKILDSAEKNYKIISGLYMLFVFLWLSLPTIKVINYFNKRESHEGHVIKLGGDKNVFSWYKGIKLDWFKEI